MMQILTRAGKREDAKAPAYSVINSLFDWSQQWKLNMNANISEVCKRYKRHKRHKRQHLALFTSNSQI